MGEIGDVATGAGKPFDIVCDETVQFVHQRRDFAGLIGRNLLAPPRADVGHGDAERLKRTKTETDLQEHREDERYAREGERNQDRRQGFEKRTPYGGARSGRDDRDGVLANDFAYCANLKRLTPNAWTAARSRTTQPFKRPWPWGVQIASA